MMQQYPPSAQITAAMEHDNAMDNIMSVVSSVDDITDKDHIREWLTAISAGWANDVAEAIHQTGDFGPDLTHTLICKDCGEEMLTSAPINPISFFS